MRLPVLYEHLSWQGRKEVMDEYVKMQYMLIVMQIYSLILENSLGYVFIYKRVFQ